MKKSNIKFLFCSVATLIALPGCDESSISGNEATKYKIEFNTLGGTKIDAIEAEASSKVKTPEDPEKNGYEFAGWYSDRNYSAKYNFGKMPNKNIEIYAKWELNTYSVTYVPGLQAENSAINPTSYNVTQNNFVLADPINPGKWFIGWYLEPTFVNEVTVLDTSLAKDITLFAKWSDTEPVDDFMITYHLDGGTNGVGNPDKYNKLLEDITLSSPTKEGYDFGGWYTDVTYQTAIETIDTDRRVDIDVYAKWTLKGPVVPTWQINYNLNGGTNGNNPIRYTADDGFIELKNPSKLSCTFQGWYSDKDFTNPITQIDCSKKENVDVYAKWLDGMTFNNLEFDFGIGTEVTIYHISDTHINAGTSASDKKCENAWINESRYSFANSFGERYDKNNLYNSSTNFFTAARLYMNSQNPDAICYTGDLMDYYSEASYNFIYNELSADTNTVPFTYSIGNHESPMSNYKGMKGTSTDGSGFSVLDIGAVQIVCFDNTYIQSSSTYTSDETLYTYTEEQYTKFKALLDTTDKPIIVAQHVPILTDYNCSSRLEKCGNHFYIDASNTTSASQKIIDLICNDPQVKMVLCGHIHGGVVCEVAEGKPEVISTSALIGTINKITIK